jgi:hypothetical protein
LGRSDLFGPFRVLIRLFDADYHDSAVSISERDNFLCDVITSDAANAGLI